MTRIDLQESFENAAPAGLGDRPQLDWTRSELTERSRYAELMLIRQGLLARRERGRFFNPKLFADPAWDMLLELYAAALTERRMTVSRLAERAGVASTTALRWIATLEREELIYREADRLDGRRIFLALTDKGRRAMSAYFEQVHPDAKIL